MNTTSTAASIEALVAEFAAQATQGSQFQALTALIARLSEPLHDAASWAGVGDALIRGRFAEPAAALLGAALHRYPQDVELHYLRGNAFRVSQNHVEAEQDFHSALARNPGHRQAALSLAFMLREQGRTNAAAAVVLALWRQHEADLELTSTLLEFVRELGAHAQARIIADAARARWPQHARIAAVAGELALALGDFAPAHSDLRRAIELDPGQSAAFLRLSYCQRYSDSADPDRLLLEDAWRNTQLPAPSRICAGFALAKLHDDLDDCASAASILREANPMARAEYPWSGERWNALIDGQIRQPALPALDADPEFVPVFIVGLPRTGTTLVATRLAQGGGVHDRGELNWIPAMYEHLAAPRALANRDALESVARLIRTQMRRDDKPTRFYVDKNPLNFRYLNLIGALFPNARILHCRRAPADMALSLWSQHFAHADLRFAYDLSTIALVADGHARLMAHWRATLPLPVLDIDYEALVADPAAQLRRVADFLQLADGAIAADAAAQSGSVITTASVWQARQPIHTRAIGRWRRYAAHIPELGRMFGEAATG